MTRPAASATSTAGCCARLACQAGIVLVATRNDGSPLDVGRRRRDPTSGLRRAVLARDHHRCTYPGCTTTRHLHVHHIQHWADNGPTELANLITLCAHHHRHLHHLDDTGQHLRIEIAPDGRHHFQHTDGTPLPHVGPAPQVVDRLAAIGTASAEATTPDPDLAGSARPHPEERLAPLAPLTWDGPGHYDPDLAIAVLQTELDRILPPQHLHTTAA